MQSVTSVLTASDERLFQTGIPRTKKEDHIKEKVLAVMSATRLAKNLKKFTTHLHGCIMNSEHDQLPVGLISAQCTGIVEVTGSNPVQS